MEERKFKFNCLKTDKKFDKTINGLIEFKY